MSENQIHPTAYVSSEAQIGENVSIGAFTLIGPQVKIGNNTKIHSHAVIDGNTTVGDNNEFYPFTSIGAAPQDLTYKGEDTKVVIGNNNVFREYVSIHRGTMKDAQVTTIGDHNLLMSYVHLGHDVVFGSHCVIANTTNFAGHVKVGDRVWIGGGCNISQFVSLSRGAYIGGASAVDRDVPTYCTAYGNRVRLKGVNIIGMRRQGHSKQEISEVVDFFRLMEASPLSPRAFVDHEEMMQDFLGSAVIEEIVTCIRSTEVGIAPFMS
jgi:UDP-N-acetylglucosamine acyltransferase